MVGVMIFGGIFFVREFGRAFAGEVQKCRRGKAARAREPLRQKEAEPTAADAGQQQRKQLLAHLNF